MGGILPDEILDDEVDGPCNKPAEAGEPWAMDRVAVGEELRTVESNGCRDNGRVDEMVKGSLAGGGGGGSIDSDRAS